MSAAHDRDRLRALPAVKAAANRIIPRDDWPSAWDGGLEAYLIHTPSSDRDLVWAWPSLIHLAGELDRAARAVGGSCFADVTVAQKDELLKRISESPDTSEAFDALRRVTFEGYYAACGGREPAGLAMVGYREVPDHVRESDPERLSDVSLDAVQSHYDAIVVGSGPGGGVAAAVLASEGKRVLVVERARNLSNAQLRGDHLHGKRNAVYWPVVGPGAGHPRSVRTDAGELTLDGGDDASLYGLNAYAVGGGSRIWQGMAWRFFPEDFRMRSTYGNPEGASLVDWPVTYEDMEPYYSRAEWELGVAGDEGTLTMRTARSARYPMPAMGSDASREFLASAADRLGWGWGPIPLAINSVPHDGRGACVRCAHCVGISCPVNAKNGSNNTFLPRAISTGLCDLLTDAEAVEIRDGDHVAGVVIMANTRGVPVEVRVTADVVIVSAGAIETPRLLLASGIGNEHMGRHLHDHRISSIVGTAPFPVKTYSGPGHSIATLDHVHSATVPWGGGVIADISNTLPLTFAEHPPVGIPEWGIAHKRWMRGDRARRFGVVAIGQEIPVPTSRVTLAGVTDRWGRPGAALRKDVHEASRLVEVGLGRQGEIWLRAAGTTDLEPAGSRPITSAAGEHSAGTARMGTSSLNSATDPVGRVWGTKRVVVCDSSLTPTNGSVNPTLTIVANAFRVAEALVAEWPP
ncbi:GMC family oxidoreductase N-terminal domain-containing protein [Agromyces bracchium]|uniref:FAD-binding protein n=1 Tax=Agromyces bracchium TaxID=88376 RepID=A0A6I3MAM9_9MICO|nr:GMC family oxidoreductase N-terminal domain-containing protein [Agromyces bracchium]MTH70394.1 FAD-binding protein [Agromyces bracchium]